MNFFEHQERARRRSGLLVIYYGMAVVMVIAIVYLVFAFVLFYIGNAGRGVPSLATLWHRDLFLWVVGSTSAVVLVGSLYKIHQLSQGGEAVARLLGGRWIESSTRDLNEKKVLNIVEEMAIASGTPVPRVFLLDAEESINAFAAGFAPGDAVIGVTRGAIQTLTRDELQGVVAHEFSHILNGDMRLNIRLIGLLHGILVIALIGYWTLRVMMRSSRVRARGRGRGDLTPLIALLGLLVMVVGYVGVFFAKLIKSAVSRQREFLADASAVQFTRNPEGIGGALAKIAGFTKGSRMESPHAEEASHFFFANGLAKSWFGFMATHPDIGERIRRIAPHLLRGTNDAQTPVCQPTLTADSGTGISMIAGGWKPTTIGQPTGAHLKRACLMLERIPASIRTCLTTLTGAEAVVFALVLDRNDPSVRAKQVAMIEEPALRNQVVQCLDPLLVLDADLRTTTAALTIPILKTMSTVQYRVFSAQLEKLFAADQTIDIFEYALQRMVRRHVARSLGLEPHRAFSRSDLRTYSTAVEGLLSCLAAWGQMDEQDAQQAFEHGARLIPNVDSIRRRSRADCGLATLDSCLAQLENAKPSVKQQVLNACAETVMADRRVTVEEAEMLRAVADALDCPIPPFLADQLAA